MRSLWCLGIVLAAAATAAAQDMPLSQILLPGEGWQVALKDGQSAGALAGDGRGNVYVADPDGKQNLAHRPRRQGVALRQDRRGGPRPRRRPGRPAVRRRTGPEVRRPTGRGGKEVGKSEGEAIRDLVVTRQGAIYGAVADDKAVYLSRDGEKRKVGEGVASPGALALWADGGTLVVGDAGDKYLYAFRVRKDGDLDAKERYYPFWLRPKEPSGNAGLTLDAAGRAYATSREGVQVFDPTGRLSGILVAPERAALGGVGLRRGGPRPAVRRLRRQGVCAEDAEAQGGEGGGGDEGAVTIPRRLIRDSLDLCEGESHASRHKRHAGC